MSLAYCSISGPYNAKRSETGGDAMVVKRSIHARSAWIFSQARERILLFPASSPGTSSDAVIFWELNFAGGSLTVDIGHTGRGNREMRFGQGANILEGCPSDSVRYFIDRVGT